MLESNIAPPQGFSYVYLMTFYCDNGKPFMLYPGITAGPLDARIGKRLTDSFYESSDSYNIQVHKLTRLMGLDNIKTEIVALVRSEYAEKLEHLLISAYGNTCCNVANTKNFTIDLSDIQIPRLLLEVDPDTYRPLDVFRNENDVLDKYSIDIFELEMAIEEGSIYNTKLWIWSDKYNIPDNSDNLYIKNARELNKNYSIKKKFLSEIDDNNKYQKELGELS